MTSSCKTGKAEYDWIVPDYWILKIKSMNKMCLEEEMFKKKKPKTLRCIYLLFYVL